MKKNTIKLNEAALRKIVAESVKKALNEIDGISSPVQTKMGWQQAFEEGVQLGKQFIESQGTSDARVAYEKNRREFRKLQNDILKKYHRDVDSARACIYGLRFSMGMGNVDPRKYQGFYGRDYLNLGGAYGADSPIMEAYEEKALKPSITEIVNRLNVAAARAWRVVDMYDEYLTAVLNVLPDRAEAKTLAVAFNKVVRHILEYAEAFKNLAKKYANTPEYKATWHL